VIDIFSEDARRNPYPLYAQLRSAAPVFREPRTGLWMLLGYDDTKRGLADAATFSSAASPGGALTSQWLIFADPPRHTRLRSLIARAFTPRSVAALEARIDALARSLLDRADANSDSGEIELIGDFAMPLPLMVVAEMIGAPPSDYATFRRWSDAIVRLSHTVSGDPRAAQAIHDVTVANAEMREYVGRLVDERRSRPENDLLTALVQPNEEGERLTDDEILGFFQLLMLAGHETTTNLIANAVLSFIEHPDQLALLRIAPELLAPAIEEVLRYRSPVQTMFRVAKKDARVGDHTIPAGQMVLLVIGAANRDPRRFDGAESFDVTRHPNAHIAFGHGIHFCVGAPLARLEARIALGLLLERWTRFERAGDEPWTPREAFHVHGPERLQLRFERSEAARA